MYVARGDLNASRLERADRSFPDLRTGLEELRAANPSDAINDDTDQYITRVVAGQLLTGVRLLSRV